MARRLALAAAGMWIAGSAAAMPAQTASADLPARMATLEDGTRINIRQKETVSSEKQKVGDHVLFEVGEDVEVDGVVVISKGTPALATMTVAKPRRMLGRGGKVQVRLDYTRLVNGEMVPLDASEGTQGKSRTDGVLGASIGIGAAFPPAMVVPLLIHGKSATFPEGTGLWAFVKGDIKMDLSKMHATIMPDLKPSALSSKLPN